MIAKLSLPLILALASVAHAADPETAADASEVAGKAHEATEDLVRKVEDVEGQNDKAQDENDQLKKDKEDLTNQVNNAEDKADESAETAQEAEAEKAHAQSQAQRSQNGAQEFKQNVQNVINKAPIGVASGSSTVASPPAPKTPTGTTSQQPSTTGKTSQQAPTTSADGSQQAPTTSTGGSQQGSTAAKKGLWSKVPDMPLFGAKARAARNWFPNTRAHLDNHKWKYGTAATVAGLTGGAWVNGKLVEKNGETVDRQLVNGDAVPAIAVPQDEATHQAYLAKESGASTLAFVGALATTAVAALTLAL